MRAYRRLPDIEPKAPEIIELLAAIDGSGIPRQEFFKRAGIAFGTYHYMKHRGRMPSLSAYIAMWGVVGKKITSVDR